MKSIIKEFIKIVIIVAIAIPVINIFAAWTEPTAAPTGGNADAPINVGSVEQVKDGILGAKYLRSFYETLLATNGGNVGIGQRDWLANPPMAKLDIEGNIKITDGTQGDGKVLTSDIDGVASWKTPISDGGTGYATGQVNVPLNINTNVNVGFRPNKIIVNYEYFNGAWRRLEVYRNATGNGVLSNILFGSDYVPPGVVISDNPQNVYVLSFNVNGFTIRQDFSSFIIVTYVAEQ